MNVPRGQIKLFTHFKDIFQVGLESPSTSILQINLPRPWSFLALSFIGSIGSCKEENVFNIHKMQNLAKCTSSPLNFLPTALMTATRTIQCQILETKNSMQSIRWWKLLKSFHFQGLFGLARWNRISAFLILSKNLRVIILRGKHHRSNTIKWLKCFTWIILTQLSRR